MSRLRASVVGFALTGALAFSVSANASGIYGRGDSLKDAPIYAPVQTSTGFYVGGNVGGVFNDNNDESFRSFDGAFFPRAGDFFFTGDRSDSTVIGGLQIGYNWQGIGSPFVVGIEGDVDFADHIDYLASIRGRVGYATPNALFYFTGGAAFIGLSDDRDLFAANPNRFLIQRFNDDNQTGFVLGGGVDFRPGGGYFGLGSFLGPNIGFGVEGLFYSFDNGRRFDVFNGNGSTFLGDFRGDDSFEFWVVRARLNYYLNQSYAPLN